MLAFICGLKQAGGPCTVLCYSAAVKPLVSLDDPARIETLRALLGRKQFLRRYYLEIYRRYAECLSRCPLEGKALELGTGAGFAKQIVPELITSDTIAYAGVDQVVDAAALPFADRSLRFICMLNVFHHLPDVEAFLREADRCLELGGRILIVDQYPGWLSSILFKYFHHEPFRPDARDWRFDSTGPLSGANGALAFLVFERDRARFEQLHPNLRLQLYRPHSPLRYWVSGGLKSWTLLPGWAFPLATAVDRLFIALSRRFGSFVDIELVKTAP